MSSFLKTWPFKAPSATTTQVADKPYVPPNWSKQTPQLYCITFRTQGTIRSALPLELSSGISVDLVKDNPGSAAGYNATTQTTMFVFDAIRRAQHSQTANLTQHPLQAGYNISDHIIKQPARVVLEVAMSDAIDSYTLAGFTPMWKMNPSKSISAYQQMEALMNNSQLLTVNTRLETYDNMALINIEVEDSPKTYFGGLAMVLSFQQVFISDVTVSYESARIQVSGETKQGTVQPQAPSKTVVDQHKIEVPGIIMQGFIPTLDINAVKIAGAGLWSSTISSLKQISAF